ncbi:unnamed protein product, partial [Amoebophrya sp. A120]|eukprot:GSA120T00003766001.1
MENGPSNQDVFPEEMQNLSRQRSLKEQEEELVEGMMSGWTSNGTSRNREQRRSKGKEHCAHAAMLSKEQAEHSAELEHSLEEMRENLDNARRQKRSKSKEHCVDAQRLSKDLSSKDSTMNRELEQLRREVSSSRENSRAEQGSNGKLQTRKNKIICKQQNRVLHPKLPDQEIPQSAPTVSSFIAEHNKTEDDKWCENVLQVDHTGQLPDDSATGEEDAEIADRYCMSMSMDAKEWKKRDAEMKRNPVEEWKLKQKLNLELDPKQLGRNVEDTVCDFKKKKQNKTGKLMSMSKNNGLKAKKRHEQEHQSLPPRAAAQTSTTGKITTLLETSTSDIFSTTSPVVSKGSKNKSSKTKSAYLASTGVDTSAVGNKKKKKKTKMLDSMRDRASDLNTSFTFSEAERSTDWDEKKELGDSVVYSYQLAAQMFYLLAQVD